METENVQEVNIENQEPSQETKIKAAKRSFLRKYICEAVGTALLVFFGCGSLCFTSTSSGLEQAFSFGIIFIVCFYVLERISGCHLNPAVSLACLIERKLSAKDFGLYCAAQVIGAIVGVAFICLINLVSPGLFDVTTKSLGANAFGEFSKSTITLAGCIIVEFIITLVFVLTFLGATSDKQYKLVAPIIIGFSLISVYLFAIPLTGASANPARTIGPAFMMMFYGDFNPILQALAFVIATMAGGAVAGYLWRFLKSKMAVE